MQRNGRVRVIHSAWCVLALAVLLAKATLAQAPVSSKAAPPAPTPIPGIAATPDILPGVDAFQTSTAKPTSVTFSGQAIPAGFFCKGSAPFTGKIELKGVPLATLPAGVAANGDVFVERLATGTFHGGAAKIPVIVRAIHLTSSNPLKIPCASGPTNWKVDVCLLEKQPRTAIVARVDQHCGCGHFDGKLTLETGLRFTNLATGKVIGPIKQEVNLRVANTPWCPKPGPGEPVISHRFRVDTGCEAKPTFIELPGTSNFHPNWTCKTQAGPDCLTQYASLTECHSAFDPKDPLHLHCTNPICLPKR